MTEQVQQFFANGLRTIFPVNEESFRAPRNRRQRPAEFLRTFLDRGNARLERVHADTFPQRFRACGFESGKIGKRGVAGEGRKELFGGHGGGSLKQVEKKVQNFGKVA